MVHEYMTLITKKNRTNCFWVDKGTNFAGEFEKLCKVEGIQICSTMSETNVAFAERTIRSLEQILYRYMEYFWYKKTHKLTQIVTTLISRRNCLTDLTAKNEKESDISSILYSKPLREYRKP